MFLLVSSSSELGSDVNVMSCLGSTMLRSAMCN